jgi:hypothetical protein
LRQLTRLSRWTVLNVLGLVVAGGGMLVQMSSGSDLYPSLTGPIVLTVTALAVVIGPSRWTRWIGLGVPLVLGIGAAVAAAMTGEFIDQLAGGDNVPLLLGSWMHVVGLIAAVTGAVAAMLEPGEAATVER